MSYTITLTKDQATRLLFDFMEMIECAESDGAFVEEAKESRALLETKLVEAGYE